MFRAVVGYPKGPCTRIVYTLASKCSLYRYLRGNVSTILSTGTLKGDLGFGFGAYGLGV